VRTFSFTGGNNRRASKGGPERGREKNVNMNIALSPTVRRCRSAFPYSKRIAGEEKFLYSHEGGPGVLVWRGAVGGKRKKRREKQA